MFGSLWKKDKNPETMSLKETALWLGRAMSTSEVAIQTLLKLLPVLTMQQKVIQQLYEERRDAMDGKKNSDVFVEMDKGASELIVKKLEEIEKQLKPVAEMVDQACSTLQKAL